MKLLVVVAVIYVLTCSVMLVLQPQTTIEPLHASAGFRTRSLREAGPGVPADEGMPSRHLKSLLQSQMFLEQDLKLKWIRDRIERMSGSWEKAARELSSSHNFLFTHPKRILLYLGLLTEYSGYDFATNAFKGGYLGELVQWSDIISTLYMLGHHVTILTSAHQLRKSIPLDSLQYDLVFTDYTGLFGLRDSQHFPMYKCRIRVLDSFGTEPIYNFRTRDFQYDQSASMFSNWNFEDLRQFWTMYPHTPDNSFLGFVVEPVTMTTTTKKNQGVLYGKEAYYGYGKAGFLNTLGEMIELHSTFKGHGNRLPSHIINHGVLSSSELKQLLSESKVFVGLGFPYDGPGPLEALAAGCVFIQPRFDPPHGKATAIFLSGKPTSRELVSQVPYLQHFVGEPYVYTLDIHNASAVRQAVYQIMANHSLTAFVPHEFTYLGVMERVGTYIKHQNFCDGEDLAKGKLATSSSVLVDHSPGEAVDGLLTERSCFWSAPDDSHWWMVDLGGDMLVSKIRITNTFEWILAKTWNSVFIDPFTVTLTDSYGNQVASRTFRDSRTSYLWEGINQRARLVRLDSMEYEVPRYFVLCNVEVFGGDSNHPTWPDLTLLHVMKSKPGLSCKDTCLQNKMLCEPSFFKALNNMRTVRDYFHCNGSRHTVTEYIDFAPAFAHFADNTLLHASQGTCVTNDNTMLLSCAGKHASYVRLCPCRKYQRGQIAIPPSSL